MMRLIDALLNRFTMYRLTLYYLIALLALGLVVSFFGVIPGGPLGILSTTAVLLAVCWPANWAIARVLKVHPNPESSLITALILALISGPVSIAADPKRLGIIALSGVVAIASKYVLAFRRQHIFNPAAFGAFFAAVVFGTYASWWVGTTALLPLVAVGGFLLARKIERLRFVGTFLAAFVAFLVAFSLAHGVTPAGLAQNLAFVFGQTAIVFFAVVMLTEPATSPKRFPLQALYAAIVAFLYQPQLTLLGGNLTPEEALLIANLFSYLVSPSFKLRLPLKERRTIGEGTMSFTFPRPPELRYRTGQFMEWSLPLANGDAKGARRYFSIASSPTEPELMIAARFNHHSSSYKQAMTRLAPGDLIVAGELGGDFVLPRDPRIPLAFVAGGIGITPFRAMIKYLSDSGQRRDIVLLYSNRVASEVVFRDVLEEAGRTIGLKTVYTLTDGAGEAEGWRGRRGAIDAQMIRDEVPDPASRLFYVSGPPSMVAAMKRELRSLGVPSRRVRTDSFAGY